MRSLWRGIHSVKTKTKYKELDIAWCFVWNLNGCNQAAHYFTGEKYPGIIIIILYYYIFISAFCMLVILYYWD